MRGLLCKSPKTLAKQNFQRGCAQAVPLEAIAPPSAWIGRAHPDVSADVATLLATSDSSGPFSAASSQKGSLYWPLLIRTGSIVSFSAELKSHLAIRKDMITCRHIDAIKCKGDRVIDIDTADRIDDLDKS